MMNVRFRPEWVLLMCCVLPFSARPQSDDDAAAQLAQQGRQALAEGRIGDAQSDFEKLSRLEPSIAEVHATLAAICFKRKNYEEALSEAKTAQRLKPTLPRLDSLVGLSLSELGRFNEALPKLEKGFKESSDVVNRRLCGLQLLRAYTGLGRDADAVETALALNKLYPDDPEVLYHTGRIYGNYAYITMEKLHDKAPNSVWMLQAQGEANESQKNYARRNHRIQSRARTEPDIDRGFTIASGAFIWRASAMNRSRRIAIRQFASSRQNSPSIPGTATQRTKLRTRKRCLAISNRPERTMRKW